MALDRRFFEALLEAAPIGAALFDAEGRYLWVNTALAVVNGLGRAEHRGRSLAEVLPEPVATRSKELLDEVVASRSSRTTEATVALPAQPDLLRTFVLTWYPVGDGGEGVSLVAALLWEVTDERTIQDQVAAAGHRLQVALEAGGMGTWDWDLRSGTLVWDGRTAAMFGVAREEFGGTFEAFGAFVHPDDAQVTSAAIEQAIETRGEFRREYRIIRPDGQIRWVSARGRVFTDADGEPEQMVGVIQDRTETHSEGERLARTLETMGDAFFRLDRELRFTYVNGRAEQIVQRSRAELLGEHIWERFPAGVGTRFQEVYEQVWEHQVPASFEAYFEPLDLWVEVRAHPDDGGVAVYFRDINERRRQQEEESAALQREQAAHAAAARLLDLTGQLHRGRSSAETALEACRAGVEVFDCERVSLWRIGGEDATLVAQHGGNPLPDGTLRPIAALPGVRDAVQAGRPRFFSVDEDDISEAERDLADHSNVGSFACAPVELGRGAGILLAVISYRSGATPPDAMMLEVAGSFAQQAALAMEQSLRREAQLEAGRLSAQLQTSLLPVPGRLPDAFEVGSLYQPGERRLLLGGDFSDVLTRPEGGLAMVIGDVTGHGPEAAAIGAALRAGWRTLALSGLGPGAMLPLLDALLRTERTTDEQLVTVCCVEVDADGREVVIASAGHPPPLLVTEHGTSLAEVPIGPLLGLPVDVEGYEQAAVRLTAPWTVLLYTDGLPEARASRTSSERLGLERFTEQVAALDPLGSPSLDTLLHELQHAVRSLADDPIGDDVALLAVRRRS
jgi:PAS domain S-box-containing protein